jgi:hypothetical protein
VRAELGYGRSSGRGFGGILDRNVKGKIAKNAQIGEYLRTNYT